MYLRAAAASAFTIRLARPVSAGAQLRLSDIRPRDVATVVDVAIRVHKRSAQARSGSVQRR
jgi:hypothetical protein